MSRRRFNASCFATLFVVAIFGGCGESSEPTTGIDVLPSEVTREEYQERLYSFLGELRYRDLGYARDKKIRDTGAWLDERYHGTHPAVQIYYSPEVIEWMESGRRIELPDGAMIIKEMFEPPAARYDELVSEPQPTQWTTMVKDRGSGTPDGWYWSYYGTDPQEPIDSDDPPFAYPNSDFGLYCVRCHTSASSELTFIDLSNVEGYPGEPIEYANDGTWRGIDPGPEDPHPNELEPREEMDSEGDGFVNQEWLATFPQFPAVADSEVQPIPPVTTSHVVARPDNQFVTSDQCQSCHSGQNPIFGPNYDANMFIEGVDVSPFGEWRWSMMGLAGRDPVFYAQLESEIAFLENTTDPELTPRDLQNLCFRCHGVMGQRELAADLPGEEFTVEIARLADRADPLYEYGALARDGVSCTVCHQIDQNSGPVEDVQTGNFVVFPRDASGNLQISGPFADPVDRPMIETLAARPFENLVLGSSRTCASCHTVFLPVLDQEGRVVDQKYEQATYLEWAASGFGDEAPTLPKQCQHCHMPDTHPDAPGVALAFQVANIQDTSYPESANEAPAADRTIPVRDDYSRHSLNGINLFVLEMFRRLPDILGVRLGNFMAGVDNGLDEAIRTATLTAQRDSGMIEILAAERGEERMSVRVRVTNLAGHRFPSGVGFRRLFIELAVFDSAGARVWASGRTDHLGIILDGNGDRLPSEFHTDGAYQPHYTTADLGHPITAQHQVQIYEEVLRDSRGEINTSFLRRVEEVKDNRLLPEGWRVEGASNFTAAMTTAIQPHGRAAADPDFTDRTGSDTLDYLVPLPGGLDGSLLVRATLYYQSIPPGYLRDRFDGSDGLATRRLHHLGSRIDDRETPFPEWKLEIATAEHEL